MTAPYQPHAEFLHDALTAAMASWDPSELAYLTATSKPEGPIRDRLAWTLQQQLHPERGVAREWKKRDLTVHTADGRPLLGVEVKVGAAFNLCHPTTPGWHPLLTALGSDLDKLHHVTPSAERYGLIVLFHIGSHIPQPLEHLVKYAADFNAAAASSEHGADGVLALSRERAKLALLHLGQPVRPYNGPVSVTGEAFGLPITIDCHLIDVTDTQLPAPYAWTQLIHGAYSLSEDGGVLVHTLDGNIVSWLPDYVDPLFADAGDLFGLWTDYLWDARLSVDMTWPRRAWTLESIRYHAQPPAPVD